MDSLQKWYLDQEDLNSPQKEKTQPESETVKSIVIDLFHEINIKKIFQFFC